MGDQRDTEISRQRTQTAARAARPARIAIDPHLGFGGASGKAGVDGLLH